MAKSKTGGLAKSPVNKKTSSKSSSVTVKGSINRPTSARNKPTKNNIPKKPKKGKSSDAILKGIGKQRNQEAQKAQRRIKQSLSKAKLETRTARMRRLEYSKEQKRILNFVKRASERGYIFSDEIYDLISSTLQHPNINSVNKLKNLTAKELYSKAKFRMPNGSIVSGTEGRKYERVQAGKKGWQTRQANIASGATSKSPKKARQYDRSAAAKKGWETRRKNKAKSEGNKKAGKKSKATTKSGQTGKEVSGSTGTQNTKNKKRSEAAKKGWETRRKNKAKAKAKEQKQEQETEKDNQPDEGGFIDGVYRIPGGIDEVDDEALPIKELMVHDFLEELDAGSKTQRQNARSREGATIIKDAIKKEVAAHGYGPLGDLLLSGAIRNTVDYDLLYNYQNAANKWVQDMGTALYYYGMIDEDSYNQLYDEEDEEGFEQL
jgi:hypothetical protein